MDRSHRVAAILLHWHDDSNPHILFTKNLMTLVLKAERCKLLHCRYYQKPESPTCSPFQ